MAHFVILANYTDQGIKAIKDTVKRSEDFKARAAKHGVTVLSLHWTLGAYDLVVVCEAKSDMEMTMLGLAMGMLGNVRTQTLHAYDAAAMAKILASVG